ncbi:vanadium-dependent haloperoxidase [Bradyrhizobium sp. CB1650]|uniref:vanadium-dependent haloperoxidase n=1 Tax=Bradyrhizobium sp. CB1650 TaxID=3039153 RepID=UPI002434E0AF|nr:vanadium-dependent haloperoxidase [Bradyrhizobium sp. CB1650]WGD53407.1 vanadium-dependent haloperoxidase [Bradyrhizobium sp. CB1650]
MRTICCLLLIVAASTCVGFRASADVIADWNEKTVTVVTNAKMAPPEAERVMAMAHVAMFDAVNAIDKRYRPYLVQPPASTMASREAAAAVAAGKVLLGLHPAAEEELRKALTNYIAAMPDGPSKSEGVMIGETVAARVLEARADDGCDATDAYRPKTKPGVYVPTPITVGSVWPKLKPFVMASQSQFRPQPPVSLKSEQWAADYNEIMALGSRASTKRTSRQTEDARFWLTPGPIVYYPIVRQLAAANKLDVVDSARFMALAAVARNDAFIAIFDAKYFYEFWRPVTAIRNGDLDDNPGTTVDGNWLPIADTPMHPEYPCAHCIMAASVASVAESVFGALKVPELTLTSPTAPGVIHHWTSLDAFVNEVSEARIWAGFHYRFSTRVGQEMGRKIGQYVVENVMQPNTMAGR